MINLLPQKEKDELFLKKAKNLAIVLGSIVIITLVCLIFVLLSVKFYVLTEVNGQSFILQDTQKNYESPDVVTVKNSIQKYNNSLPTVLSFYQSDKYLSNILAAISEIEKPNGLYFTNIFLDSQAIGGNVKVNISGTSDTRESLIAFQKNLEKQNAINNISFSPESWINPVKANFNLNFDYGN
jgi:hypothetical protein